MYLLFHSIIVQQCFQQQSIGQRELRCDAVRCAMGDAQAHRTGKQYVGSSGSCRLILHRNFGKKYSYLALSPRQLFVYNSL